MHYLRDNFQLIKILIDMRVTNCLFINVPRLLRNAVTSCSLSLLIISIPTYAQTTTVKGVEPALADLITKCAPTVHPETMAALVSGESRGHQYAIADAGPVNLPWAQRKHMVRSIFPKTHEEAVSTAQSLIASGHTVSLGFAQINDRNLRKLGISLNDIFTPCTNLAAGGRVLTEFYGRAVTKFGPGTQALRASLSAYNSGDWFRGEKDGYVDMVYRQVGKPLAISAGANTLVSTHEAPQRVIKTIIPPPKRRDFAMSTREFSIAD